MQWLRRGEFLRMPSVGMGVEDARRRTSTRRGRTSQSDTLIDIEAVAPPWGAGPPCPPSGERGSNPVPEVGHLLRFDPADIEAWLDEARVVPLGADGRRRF